VARRTSQPAAKIPRQEAVNIAPRSPQRRLGQLIVSGVLFALWLFFLAVMAFTA
jgi:hypothetical protein